jgi:hypothetical protein
MTIHPGKLLEEWDRVRVWVLDQSLVDTLWVPDED